MKEIEDSGTLKFLKYAYDNIASAEYPASAFMLKYLRSGTESDTEFYRMVTDMDFSDACSTLGIGKASVYQIQDLCSAPCKMVRRIVSNPEARMLFEDRNRVEGIAPILKERIMGGNRGIRTFHAYQKLKDKSKGSILNLYLRLVGLPQHTVKLPNLNAEKSRDLIDLLKKSIPEIVESIPRRSPSESNKSESATADSPRKDESPLAESEDWTSLYGYGLSVEDVERIASGKNSLGHFPMFMFMSCLVSNMNRKKRTISKSTLNIIYGKSLDKIDDVAAGLNLTRERVRQIREMCLRKILLYPETALNTGKMEDYVYQIKSNFDFDRIRKEEEVDFSNNFITYCISETNKDFSLVGNVHNALTKPSGPSNCLYLVPKRLHDLFSFEDFISKVEEMIHEKRYCTYRDDLETFVKWLLKNDVSDADFYAVVKECRQILVKSYPDNIINNQIVFPANARKNIPELIEDVLREFNRPMTSGEISEQMNIRFPDLGTTPAKIGANALRNNNIAPISRSSTYTLAEWDHTEKRGGTIRNMAVEYLNSLPRPIASLSAICTYISKFRENVKEKSVEANLLAEASNRFSLFYNGDVPYIGFSDYDFGDEYSRIIKRDSRRSFEESIARLERFIKENGRFPYTSGVGEEEARLSRFYCVAKANKRKGTLSEGDLAEFERINDTYGDLRVKKDRISWDEMLERLAKYMTDNGKFPFHSSKEYKWYEENKALFDNGGLNPERSMSFSILMKIVDQTGSR